LNEHADVTGSSELEGRLKTEKSEVTSTPTLASEHELAERRAFYETFSECPIPPNELLANLGLFVNRQSLSRILFMHDLYLKILPVHGIVAEFGVRWGQNLALFSSFRGIYEPYNYTRRIIGFDTFAGFPAVSKEDGGPGAEVGGYNVTSGYEAYLESVLTYHEWESPLPHIRKHEIVKGDVTVTLERYLSQHPETVIALAYFDLDLYEPTKTCLELIRDRVTKGTVIGFDEVNSTTFPGETLAVKEILGLDRYAIHRMPTNPTPSYIVVE